MTDWLWVAGVLSVAGSAAAACVWGFRKGQAPERVPDSQTRPCAPQAPANRIPDCCLEGVHSPFWCHGYPCRYCGAAALVEPDPPTVPDHLWRPDS